MMISALGFHCHCHYIRNNRYKPIVFLKHVSQALNLPAVQRGSSSKNYIRSFLRSNFIKQKSLINIHKHMVFQPKLFTKKPTKENLEMSRPFDHFSPSSKFHELGLDAT